MHWVVFDNNRTENNSQKSLRDRFHTVGLICVFLVDKYDTINYPDCLFCLKLNSVTEDIGQWFKTLHKL